MTRYETWEERDGATMRQRVGTDAPAGMRLVDADYCDKLEAENKRLREALENIIKHMEIVLGDMGRNGVVAAIARAALHDTKTDAELCRDSGAESNYPAGEDT